MRAVSPAQTEGTALPAHSNRGLTTLRGYFSVLRGQEPVLALAGLLMLASTAVSRAIPVFAGRIVDAIGSRSPGSTVVSPYSADQVVLVLGALLLAQLASSFLFSVVSARLALETVTRLRRRLYAHLLELPALFFSGQKAGDLSTRVTGDVGAIQYVLTGGPGQPGARGADPGGARWCS
ncbi:MAG: hypothetical protein IPK20_00305 [Betaproteobacteria bacterium]|nr:hypothetical protein [Betaproteobacteria bacterium]